MLLQQEKGHQSTPGGELTWDEERFFSADLHFWEARGVAAV
jgi:hypothetical protein